MLLKRATLTALATGTPVAVFRRWREPRVRVGSTFRTALGVIAVERIEPTVRCTGSRYASPGPTIVPRFVSSLSSVAARLIDSSKR